MKITKSQIETAIYVTVIAASLATIFHTTKPAQAASAPATTVVSDMGTIREGMIQPTQMDTDLQGMPTDIQDTRSVWVQQPAQEAYQLQGGQLGDLQSAYTNTTE